MLFQKDNIHDWNIKQIDRKKKEINKNERKRSLNLNYSRLCRESG